MNDIQPTPATEFRRANTEGVVRTLSSGRVVRQRPITLMRLVKAGKVPDSLTPYVMSLVWSSEKEETRDDKTQMVEWLDYLDLIAKASLVDPVVVESPQAANEIAPDDLTYDELVQIHAWARTPNFAEVKTFPVEQSGNLESGTEGGESEQAAKRVSARAN